MKRQRRTLLLVTLVASVIAPDKVKAQSFNVPTPDLRVALNAEMFTRMVALTDGYGWGGNYDRHANPCNSPDVHLELQKPSMLFRSWSSLVDGNGGLHIRITGTPKVYTNDGGCGNVSGTASCSIDGCFTSLVPGFALLGASCRFFGIEMFRDVIVVPSPLQLVSQIPIELPTQPVPNGAGEISFEFGSFVRDKWERALRPHSRVVTLEAAPRGLGGQPLKGACKSGQDPTECDDAVCSVPKSLQHGILRRESSTAVLDSYVAPRRFQTFSDVNTAETQLNSGSPIQPTHLAGIRIGKRFMLGDDGGGGFFQRVLPIRVFGHQMSGKQKVNFEFFLTKVTGKFGQWNNSDSIELSFVVSQPTAWLESNSQAKVAIKTIGIEAVATLPQFRPDRNPQPNETEPALFEMSLVQFRVGFHVDLGTAHICFESKKLEEALKTISGPLARYAGPGPLLPDCLEADANIRAFRACKDGRRDGFVSAERPERNLVVRLDIGRASSKLVDGDWMTSVPPAASLVLDMKRRSDQIAQSSKR
jgi:hypothetical protein